MSVSRTLDDEFDSSFSSVESDTSTASIAFDSSTHNGPDEAHHAMRTPNQHNTNREDSYEETKFSIHYNNEEDEQPRPNIPTPYQTISRPTVTASPMTMPIPHSPFTLEQLKSPNTNNTYGSHITPHRTPNELTMLLTPSAGSPLVDYRGTPIDPTMRRNLLPSDHTPHHTFRDAAATSLSITAPQTLLNSFASSQVGHSSINFIDHLTAADDPTHSFLFDESLEENHDIEVVEASVEEVDDAIEEMGAYTHANANESSHEFDSTLIPDDSAQSEECDFHFERPEIPSNIPHKLVCDSPLTLSRFESPIVPKKDDAPMQAEIPLSHRLPNRNTARPSPPSTSRLSSSPSPSLPLSLPLPLPSIAPPTLAAWERERGRTAGGAHLKPGQTMQQLKQTNQMKHKIQANLKLVKKKLQQQQSPSSSSSSSTTAAATTSTANRPTTRASGVSNSRLLSTLQRTLDELDGLAPDHDSNPWCSGREAAPSTPLKRLQPTIQHFTPNNKENHQTHSNENERINTDDMSMIKKTNASSYDLSTLHALDSYSGRRSTFFRPITADRIHANMQYFTTAYAAVDTQLERDDEPY